MLYALLDMKQSKDLESENQPQRATPQQSAEAFKAWQEGGKEALGKLLLKNKAKAEAKKKDSQT